MCVSQVFKFIYSCRLADVGLATQAFHYCEAIARSVLLQPQSHSPVLISQLVEVPSPRTSDGRPAGWAGSARGQEGVPHRCSGQLCGTGHVSVGPTRHMPVQERSRGRL